MLNGSNINVIDSDDETECKKYLIQIDDAANWNVDAERCNDETIISILTGLDAFITQAETGHLKTAANILKTAKENLITLAAYTGYD